MAKLASQACAILLAFSYLPVSRAAGGTCDWYPYVESQWTTCVSGASMVCKDGTEQSPIDFDSCSTPKTMPTIDLTQWTAQDVTIKNNGHTIEVSTPPAVLTTTVGSGTGSLTLKLAQCHFHWTSEHTVDGNAYDLCVHCVHKKPDQTQARKYAVVGRFYELKTSTNTIFEDLEYPSVNDTATKMVDLKKLFEGADMNQYWAYLGGLTTPGCAEAVDWKFLMSVGDVSQAYLDAFTQSMGNEPAASGNFRPPQPLHNRVVDGCYCPWYPYSASNWSTCAKGHDAACSAGQEQSPIDFSSCTNQATMTEIDMTQWMTQDVTVKNNGHTIEVAATPAFSTTVGNVQATLAQCHFHWTSEHTVDGSAYDLCVHCVHAKTGQPQARKYIVVGRFYSAGASTNQIFADLEDYPGMSSQALIKTNVSLVELFAGADMTHYWAYLGGLTTPGCDEVVDWKFLMDVGDISQTQLTTLKQSMGAELAAIGNFRPPQPLNGRVVDGCYIDASSTVKLGLSSIFQPLLWTCVGLAVSTLV